MLFEEEVSDPATTTAKTILIVEDDEDTLVLYAEALSTFARCCLYLARDSSEALQSIEHIQPDVYILDYRLPGINGIQLYDQLHALARLEHVPAIIVSAFSSENLTRDIESRKLIRIEKPFDVDVFEDTIRRALA
jgi:DNA-binding NtrC family response regulator